MICKTQTHTFYSEKDEAGNNKLMMISNSTLSTARDMNTLVETKDNKIYHYNLTGECIDIVDTVKSAVLCELDKLNSKNFTLGDIAIASGMSSQYHESIKSDLVKLTRQMARTKLDTNRFLIVERNGDAFTIDYDDFILEQVDSSDIDALNKLTLDELFKRICKARFVMEVTE